jgi:Skp family chaperone for outer membrane proteins
MRKRIFSAFLLAGILWTSTALAGDGIVFVDLQEVFKRFYKTQLAQDQLRQQSADIKVELESMQEEVKSLKEEIDVLRADSRDETLSDEIRDGKLSQLEEKLVALRQKERDVADFEKLRMQQLEQQNKRMTRKIFDEIKGVINDFSREKGYNAVIDRSAQSRSGTPVVLFARSAEDITGDVLAVLNEGREDQSQGENAPQNQ